MKLFGLNIFEKRSEETQNLKPVEESATGFSLGYYIKQMAASTTLSAVFAAVELISNSLAQLPIHIKNRKTGEIVEHPVEKIFYTSLLSKFILMKQLITDMLINGSGIAYIIRNSQKVPTGLVYCAKGEWSRTYDPLNGKILYQIPKCSTTSIPDTDVIDLYKNSQNGVDGKGLIFYALRTLSIYNSAEQAAQNYYDSGCKIDGILKSSRRLSTKQQSAIQAAWQTAHNGYSSAAIPVLDIDLDYVPISGNANESQLLETRKFSIQEVARYFNLNPMLLGDLSHTAYNSLEQAQLEFIQHSLMPYIELIQDEFNRKLFGWDSDYVIDLDENHAMVADKSATSNYLKTLTGAGILSINEARHQLGYQPIENGDDHIIPFTNLAQNTIEDQKNTDLKDE